MENFTLALKGGESVTLDQSIFMIDDEKGMVNLTAIAKACGRRVSKWLELPSTKEYIKVYSEVRKSGIEVIKRVKGGNLDNLQQGTWAPVEVAYKFAMWISPAFEVWVTMVLKELFETGKVELKQPEEPRFTMEFDTEANRVSLAYEFLDLQKRSFDMFEKILSGEIAAVPVAPVQPVATVQTITDTPKRRNGKRYDNLKSTRGARLHFAEHYGFKVTYGELKNIMIERGIAVISPDGFVLTEAGKKYGHTTPNSASKTATVLFTYEGFRKMLKTLNLI